KRDVGSPVPNGRDAPVCTRERTTTHLARSSLRCRPTPSPATIAAVVDLCSYTALEGDADEPGPARLHSQRRHGRLSSCDSRRRARPPAPRASLSVRSRRQYRPEFCRRPVGTLPRGAGEPALRRLVLPLAARGAGGAAWPHPGPLALGGTAEHTS